MFGSTTRSAANAYGKVALETSINMASPHRLIVMLFDGALAALTKARHDMNTGNVPGKGKAISHAISIIDNGLRASLDKKSGGDIAQSLEALYQYMADRLLLANLRNAPEIIDEVHGLLKELKGAWESIGTDSAATLGPTAQPELGRDPLAPQAARMYKA